MQLCRSVKSATAINRNYTQYSNPASSIPVGLREDGYETIAKYLHLQFLQNILSPRGIKHNLTCQQPPPTKTLNMAATCFHKNLLCLLLKSLLLFPFFSKEAAKNLLPSKSMAPLLICQCRVPVAARHVPPHLPRSLGSAIAPPLRRCCSLALQPWSPNASSRAGPAVKCWRLT